MELITLKVLKVVFAEDTTQEKIDEVFDRILDLAEETGTTFIIESCEEVERIPEEIHDV
ncbi:MAG: hypothetical protein ACM3PY_21365 [Omnitrophica WOR_2 bacterium]